MCVYVCVCVYLTSTNVNEFLQTLLESNSVLNLEWNKPAVYPLATETPSLNTHMLKYIT